MHVASAPLVKLKELIAYKTLHGVIWLDGEDQKSTLSYKGLSYWGKGQARGSGTMDRRGSEARAKGLALMD